ncbi:9792_t:CDS:1, partial [Scutellospora calospora]
KNRCYCRHLSYEKPIRNKHVDNNGRSSFLMEDYEVLQIHEKSLSTIPNLK